MNERPTKETGLRIVDAVFARERAHVSWRFAAAPLAALLVHGMALAWAVANGGKHREPAVGPEQVVELTAPPPPPPPSQAPPPPVAPPPPPPTEPRPPRQRSAEPPPPAQAGRIIAQEPDPAKPVDLGDRGFVTGTGQTYAGGYTSSSGTNTEAVTTREVDPQSKNLAGPDLSRPVGLVDADWTCPWPHQADDREIDEEVVVIKVVVRPDGSAESAQVINDPGFGFGPAAVVCAQRTRFRAARDRQGNAIHSNSPPIRVRFTR